MNNASWSVTKWLFPLLLLGGCSILLEPSDQCAVDGDCGSTLYVCRAGLCVPHADGGADGSVLESTDPYVLSYFTSDQTLSSDSLHLAYSTDGLHWEALNFGQAVYTLSDLGSNHIRDPFIFKKNDGTFVYMATDWTLSQNDANYWNNPSSRIFLADSTDLITFTNPRLLEVTPLEGPGGSEMHAWAPEAFFDAERQEYGIIWSGNDSTGRNRIYVSYTTDFQTLVNPTPEVFFDPGYSVIDGTVVPYGGRNYLFFKDESDNNGGALTGSGKDIQIARTQSSSLAAGSFARLDIDYITRGMSQSVRKATEGPLVFKVPNQSIWFMCADYFLAGGSFGCWRTTSLDADPNSWTALSADQYNFPAGARHAGILQVTPAQLDALIARYGVAPEVQIRTSYSEGSPAKPFYIAHSYYHAMMTTLDDRANGQLEGDFAWKVVPGLADPSDPELVSFEAVVLPGYYLNIDPTNVARFPNCPEGSNRGAALCALPAGERSHLAWVSQLVDSPSFKQGATFRRTNALNGDGGMRSFQWYPDSTRYLRHASYQIFALPSTTTMQMNDASFTLEDR